MQCVASNGAAGREGLLPWRIELQRKSQEVQKVRTSGIREVSEDTFGKTKSSVTGIIREQGLYPYLPTKKPLHNTESSLVSHPATV
jgi:hypothetical protein